MTTISQEEPIPLEFYKKRNKKEKEKIENIKAWIQTNNKCVWCFFLIDDKKEIVSICGKENTQDKLKLELIPLIELLEWIHEPDKKKNLIVYTKSLYVINCLNEWIEKWKRNDFKIEENTNRPNSVLLRKIDILKKNISINVKLLVIENEFSKQCDDLITKYTD